MNLQPWPYVQFNGEWSIPDIILGLVWKKLEENGKIEELFYEGGMRTVVEFIEFFQNPNRFLIFVADADSKKVIAIGFLTNFDSNKAYVHFSFIDEFEPSAGKVAIDFWRQMTDGNGNKVLDVLIGVTPESYPKVIKIINKWGFQVIGTIPLICNMFYKNKKEGGIISYLTLGG
jgi:hypothetical protein